MSNTDEPKSMALEELARETARAIRRRPDALFELERPEEVVPLLPVQELLFAIGETGVADATDLVALTTPEQLQAFLDLSWWQRDRLDLEVAQDWLGMLLELERGDLLRKVRGLDPELLGVVLRQYVQILDLSDYDADEGGHGGWQTPDTFYELLPLPPVDPDTGEVASDWDPEEDDRFSLAVRLLNRIYEADPELGRSLVMEALAGTLAELEELSYRWRAGRVADLGYESYADALEILQFVSPERLLAELRSPDPAPPPPDPGDPVSAGGVLLEPVLGRGDEPFLEACLDSLSEADRRRVTQGFTFLTNRVAAATLARPGDADDMAEVLRQTRRGLSLGLEYLTQRDAGRAPQIFERLAVATVFRVGHSLKLQLQRLVATLHQRGRLSLAATGATLLEGPWLALVEGLGRRFPELPRAFDAPELAAPAATPEAGEGSPAEKAGAPGAAREAGKTGFRPILDLDDLAHGAALVEDLAALWPLCMLGLRFDPRYLTEEGLAGCQPSEPGAVRLGDLFRTTVVRHLLGEPFNLAPLGREQLEATEAVLRQRREAAKEAGVTEAVQTRAEEALVDEVVARTRKRLEAVAVPVPERLERIVRVWLTPLLEGPLTANVLRRGPQGGATG